MKAICFHCHYVSIGALESACPQCGFPLIMNHTSAALANHDLERLFTRKLSAPPLPGVNPEPRKAELLMKKRRERIARLQEARRRAQRRAARRRLVGELFAASAVLAGIFCVLGALGAL